MYRDDLEAAQARADALEREAGEQRERADEAEREAEALRAKNAELAAQVAHPKQAPDASAAAARMRRSKIGWSLILVGLVTTVISVRLDLPVILLGPGPVIFVLGCILA